MASSMDVWLITGVAGFIGSNLMERLLRDGHTVRGIDNLSSGSMKNVELALKGAGVNAADRFSFYEGDITDAHLMKRAMKDVNKVVHLAALVSVHNSIKNPSRTAEINVGGFVNVLKTAVDFGVKRFVYASSSAVYGDSDAIPIKEDIVGAPLSPYAASKTSNEIFAQAMGSNCDIEHVGLRFFNIYGPRQNREGGYASVIPMWITALLDKRETVINGDPSITRDFIYIDDVIDAVINAATLPIKRDTKIFNIGSGDEVALSMLHERLVAAMELAEVYGPFNNPEIGPPRLGDIKRSVADISLAENEIKFRAKVDMVSGLEKTIRWFSKKP